MNKIKYAFAGALVGVFAYPVTCIFLDEEGAVIGIIAGFIIGLIAGANADKEQKLVEIEAKRQAEENARIAEQEERKRQHQAAVQAEEDTLKHWSESRLIPVLKAFDTIESIIDVNDDGHIQYAQPFYDQQNASNCRRKLDELKAEAAQKDHSAQFVSYSKHFQTELNNTISSLNGLIQSIINDYKKFKFDFRASLPDSLCRLAYLTGDDGYMTSANAAYLFLIATLDSITQVDMNNYVLMPAEALSAMPLTSVTCPCM